MESSAETTASVNLGLFCLFFLAEGFFVLFFFFLNFERKSTWILPFHTQRERENRTLLANANSLFLLLVLDAILFWFFIIWS